MCFTRYHDSRPRRALGFTGMTNSWINAHFTTSLQIKKLSQRVSNLPEATQLEADFRAGLFDSKAHLLNTVSTFPL